MGGAADPFAHLSGLQRIPHLRATSLLNGYRSSLRQGRIPPASGLSALQVSDLISARFSAYGRVLPRLPLMTTHGVEWRRWDSISDKPLDSFPGIQLAGLLQTAAAASVAERIEPLFGQLDYLSTVALVELLGASSAASTCSFYFWGGRAPLDEEQGPYLYEAPLATLTRLHLYGPPTNLETPDAWWPNSGEWMCATYTDATSIYFGGSRDLLERALQDPCLEIVAVTPATLVDDWMQPVR